MADSSHPIRTRSTWIYAGLVFAAAIITDQASKLWARTALDGSDTIPVIGQWLSLRLVHNSGAAFSFAAGKTWILTIFTVVIIGVLAVLARRVHRASTLLAIALLAGGAVGNLIDRLSKNLCLGHRFFDEIRQIHSFFYVFRQKLQIL